MHISLNYFVFRKKEKGKKVIDILKVRSDINKKVTGAIGIQSQTKRDRKITITDLLELLVLLCSIIMQQYTLQCTIHRNSSATLPLPPDQLHISSHTGEKDTKPTRHQKRIANLCTVLSRNDKICKFTKAQILPIITVKPKTKTQIYCFYFLF